MNTIVALSTPMGRGAIAVVRLSGEESKQIASQIFAPMPKKPNLLKVGFIDLKKFREQAMCVYFDAPKSYTGEDMVEFHCHGGNVIAAEVISLCLEKGARLAKNGEFSKIAFLNGKQNLSNAEGIIEMIDAETRLAAMAGADLMNNRLGLITAEYQDKLTNILAQVEVALDYPEEELDLPTAKQVKQQLQETVDKIQTLADTIRVGRLCKQGINIAIVGRTNVGKSSLLNALLGENRAIVSDIEGTTRDTITESIIYKDIKYNFVDTAGLRRTADEIEILGISRTRRAIEQADIVLNVADKPQEFEDLATDKPMIRVLNKCDLEQDFSQDKRGDIALSATNNINIEGLKELIYQKFSLGQFEQSDVILTNERHFDCINRAKTALNSAISAIDDNTLDCVAVEIKAAWQILGEITGTTANEEIIDRIYSKFCLGK